MIWHILLFMLAGALIDRAWRAVWTRVLYWRRRDILRRYLSEGGRWKD